MIKWLKNLLGVKEKPIGVTCYLDVRYGINDENGKIQWFSWQELEDIYQETVRKEIEDMCE